MRVLLLRLALGFAACAWAQPGLAQATASGDHVQVTWLAPQSFSSTQHTTTIALHFAVDEHWHVYWRNAGDSGAAPKFQFAGEGVTVSPPLWPVPSRLPVAHLTNLGYEGDVAYLFTLTKNPQLTEVKLQVALEWLVCKVDCIPGFATMTLARQVFGAAEVWHDQDRATLAHYQQQLPLPASEFPYRILGAEYRPLENRFSLSMQGMAASAEVGIWPLDGNFINAAAPQVARTGGTYTATFTTLPVAQPPSASAFVVSIDGKAWHTPEVAVTLASTEPAIASSALPLAVLLGLALLGGIILNLMPCVLPVLSIKVFQLIKRTRRGAQVTEGLAYGAGVVVTFAALGLVFVGLRAAGLAVGWGFQLQSPWVVWALMVLFWCLALGFLGAYEWGSVIMRWAGARHLSGATSSAFLTGVLAVFVAAPCTGPFMGAALGAATLVTPLAALALFCALGVGLALPLVAIALWPPLQRLLPAPGAWMNRLREFFAFPLFATVLWLAWVLAALVGAEAWVWSGISLLLVAMAIWAVTLGTWLRGVLLAMVGVGLAYSVIKIVQPPPPAPLGAERSAWQAFSPAEVEQARRAGRSVFVDFTAAWCITCQVNKTLVLDTAKVAELFAVNNTQLLRADWTRYDPVITAALAQHGRNSVPLYLFYPVGGQAPRILPQILSYELLAQTVQSAATLAE